VPLTLDIGSQIVDDDRSALASQLQGDRLADAVTGPGHQCHAALQSFLVGHL
jgi:hypothetical protein